MNPPAGPRAAEPPYLAPPPTATHVPPPVEPMPFDHVYSNRHAGYDTRSSVPLGQSGGQPAVAEPEPFSSVYSDRHAGFDTRSNVPLGSQAYMNSTFAGEGEPGIYGGRYAGLSTKSSLTLAHFGGNDATAQPSMYQTTSKSTYTPPRFSPYSQRISEGPCAPVEPNPYTARSAYEVNPRGIDSARQGRQLVQNVPAEYGNVPQDLQSQPREVSFTRSSPRSGISNVGSSGLPPASEGSNQSNLKLPPISQEQAEGLIREVARLRVENRELTERLKACTCGSSKGVFP